MAAPRVNEMDVLRLLAALAVVLLHYLCVYPSFRAVASPYPVLSGIAKYGYLGVQMFFLISGFVILMTASSEGFQKFVIARMARLYPAFWVCCTITAAMAMTVGTPPLNVSMYQYLLNMTMTANFFGVPPVDGAYWTLFIELRFYALVALVLVLGRIRQVEVFLVAWALATTVLRQHPVRGLNFFLIPDFSAYFIAGATFYLVWLRGLSLRRVGLLCITLTLALAQQFDVIADIYATFHTTLDPRVVVGIVTSLFLLMLLIALRKTGFLAHLDFRLAGAISYPLYLLHAHFGYMLFDTLSAWVNPHILFWGTLVCVFALAYAIHVLVEKPLSKRVRATLSRTADNVEHLALQARGYVWVRR